MPELPDVEAMRRYLLAQGLVGRRIAGVELRWPRAVQAPSPEAFVRGLSGRRIEALERRAKFLLFRLDAGWPFQSRKGWLALHLRMTGSLLVVPAGTPLHPHVRNLFHLDDGRDLWFADPRKLGQMWLVEDPAPLLAHLGPEPSSPEFTLEALASRLNRRAVPIKALLLEQDVAAGLGNIYADEVLFVAGIHPQRRAGELSRREVARLHGAIAQVLQEATNKLASVLPIAGPPTESEEGLMLLQVPRMDGAPCRRCGTAVRRVAIRGRSAYFCPRCQQ